MLETSGKGNEGEVSPTWDGCDTRSKTSWAPKAQYLLGGDDTPCDHRRRVPPCTIQPRWIAEDGFHPIPSRRKEIDSDGFIKRHESVAGANKNSQMCLSAYASRLAPRR